MTMVGTQEATLILIKVRLATIEMDTLVTTTSHLMRTGTAMITNIAELQDLTASTLTITSQVEVSLEAILTPTKAHQAITLQRVETF
jgi:hypothetical protein